jgi:hypothetical protein
MEPIILQQVVDCPGATIRNDALQPVSEPILTVTLKAQGGQLYLLPLSEQGARSKEPFGGTLKLAARFPVTNESLSERVWKSGIVSVDYLLDFAACSLPLLGRWIVIPHRADLHRIASMPIQ